MWLKLYDRLQIPGILIQSMSVPTDRCTSYVFQGPIMCRENVSDFSPLAVHSAIANIVSLLLVYRAALNFFLNLKKKIFLAVTIRLL